MPHTTSSNRESMDISVDKKSRRKTLAVDEISLNSTSNNAISTGDDVSNQVGSKLTGTVDSEKWLEIKNVKRNYWKREEELLLQEWADKAQCYEWMHFKSHEKYKSQNTWFTIPVIVISTITGTANFAQERFGERAKPYVAMGVGTANIIAGVITTIYQYLKIAELNESHKIAYNEWGKLYRKLKTELMKHPFDRENHTLFMKFSKKEYDRLIETCPSIPKDVVKMFNDKHKKAGDLIKPEICNSVKAIHIFEMTEEERQEMVDELHEDTIAMEEEQVKLIADLRNEIDRLRIKLSLLTSEKSRLQDDIEVMKEKPIEILEIDENLENFKKSFSQVNGRPPTDEEIQTLYNEIYLTDNAETININDNGTDDYPSTPTNETSV